MTARKRVSSGFGRIEFHPIIAFNRIFSWRLPFSLQLFLVVSGQKAELCPVCCRSFSTVVW
jgi:hypothetical protein